jgi:NodT family efflux transporter outer membrane factor (OMF) lipoprotein
LLVVITAPLVACFSLGPDFERPESEVADEWVGAADDRVSSDSSDYAEWWKTFEDPVLESLIAQTYEQNLDLQIAGLRVLEARAIVGFAVGTRYPQVQQVGASAGLVSISEEADPVSSLPSPVREGVDTNFGNYRAGFDAAWELDFWGRFRRAVESSDANLAATIATYDDVRVTLTGEVAAAYVLLRTLEERLEVARSNVAIQQRSLEISEARSRNQLTTELDPALARALLRDTQSSVPQLEASVRQVKNALSVLVGKPPGALDTELAAGGGIPATPTEVAVGIPSELLRRRPDVRRAEAQAAAQSARIGIAKAELFPAFSLLGSIGVAASSSGDLFTSGSGAGFGLVRFSWNIFNYGRIRNLVRVQDARFQQLIVNYQNTVLKAAREVEDATASFLGAQQQVTFLEDGAQASQRAVELALIQYRDGVADYTRVLDSQRFLVLQQDRLTQARGRVARSLIAMYKALGGGWEQRNLDELVREETRRTMSERTGWGNLLEPDGIDPVPEEERGSWRLPDR